MRCATSQKSMSQQNVHWYTLDDKRMSGKRRSYKTCHNTIFKIYLGKKKKITAMIDTLITPFNFYPRMSRTKKLRVIISSVRSVHYKYISHNSNNNHKKRSCARLAILVCTVTQHATMCALKTAYLNSRKAQS